jgi:hypothetical protein
VMHSTHDPIALVDFIHSVFFTVNACHGVSFDKFQEQLIS